MLWLKTAGVIIGEIIYFIVISHLWKSIGWRNNFSHAGMFGILTFFLVSIVNAFVCAYLATQFARTNKRIMKWISWFTLLGLVIACVHINHQIALYDSGYESYFTTPTFSGIGESWAAEGFVDLVGIVTSVIIFIISYKTLPKKQS